MENRRNRVALALMALVLVLSVALGAVAPGMAKWVADPEINRTRWNGLERLVAPGDGGGSNPHPS